MADFDLRYISLGAGVQSTAMYLMAVEGELTPMPDFAVFADTQSEPKHVYTHLKWLIYTFGHIIPIHTSTEGNLRDRAVRGGFTPVPFWVERDGRESLGRRQCTRQFKLEACKQEVRRELGLSRGERAAGKYSVECWVGISVDEATRAKPSRDSWIENRFPLLYDVPMRRGDCLDWMEGRGHPLPGRSACTFCPFQGHREWVAMRDRDPDSFEDACQVDEAIGPEQFVHRSLRPLREVIDDPDWDETRQVNMFEEECEGMCGV